MEEATIIPLLVVFAIIVIAIAITKLRQANRSESEEELRTFNNPAEETVVPSAREPAKLSDLLPPQFVVLDLETTGLNPATDEIIEIGAIRVTLDAKNQLAFQTFVRPTRKVPRKITNITGITQEMVDSDGIPLEEALCQFKEFIGDLPLVTFNAEFDMGFLHNAAKRHGAAIPNPYTCALKRARRAWPELPSYRLVDLAKWGNLSDVSTHRALGDCERALIVFTSATSTLGQKVRWTKPTATSSV